MRESDFWLLHPPCRQQVPHCIDPCGPGVARVLPRCCPGVADLFAHRYTPGGPCSQINFAELWHQAAGLNADFVVWPSAMKTPDPSTYGCKDTRWSSTAEIVQS